MSVEEMKKEAMKQLSKLNDERIIKDIFTLLNKISEKTDSSGNIINLSQHYDDIKNQYDDVLRKLAQ